MLATPSETGNVAIAGLAAVHDDLHLCLLRGPVAWGDAGRQGTLGGGGEGLGQGAGGVWGTGGASPLQRRVPRLPRVVVVRVVLLWHSTHLERTQEPLQPGTKSLRLVTVQSDLDTLSTAQGHHRTFNLCHHLNTPLMCGLHLQL